MSQLRYACASCGTWTCDRCGWKRPGASVTYRNHTCGVCPGNTGQIVPTMHTERMWWLHNEGPLPTGYPYGKRPETAQPVRTGGPAPKDTVPPREFYRGVPVPGTGPYSRLDVPSWKRGVDAALDRAPRLHGRAGVGEEEERIMNEEKIKELAVRLADTLNEIQEAGAGILQDDSTGYGSVLLSWRGNTHRVDVAEDVDGWAAHWRGKGGYTPLAPLNKPLEGS